MEKRTNLIDIINNWTHYWYLVIGAYMTYFFIKIGKKVSDFLFTAAVEKVIKTIDDIVNTAIKTAFDPVYAKLHGAVEKNEGVLLEYVKKLEVLEKKLEEKETKKKLEDK